jgi:raffinose/stachyose/melibiose transport system substrate-binding protein
MSNSNSSVKVTRRQAISRTVASAVVGVGIVAGVGGYLAGSAAAPPGQSAATAATATVTVTSAVAGGTSAVAGGTFQYTRVPQPQSWGFPMQQAAAAAWQKAHPEYTMQVLDIDQATAGNKLPAAFLAGQPPDVFDPPGYSRILFDYVGLGPGLIPLDEYIPYAVGKRFRYGATTAPVTYQGKLWAIPWELMFTCVYLNKAIFEQNNIEVPTSRWTLDDFWSICEKLKKAGVIPLAFGNADKWPANQPHYLHVERHGGPELIPRTVNREPGYKWTDDDFIKGSNDLMELVNRGYYNKDVLELTIDDAVRLFGLRKAAMMQYGNWPYVDWIKTFPDLGKDLVVLPWPVVPNGKGTATEVLGGTYGVSIANTEFARKHIEDLVDIGRFYCDPELQLENMAKNGMQPGVRGLDPARIQDPVVRQLDQLASTFTYVNDFLNWYLGAELTDFYLTTLAEMLSKNRTVEEAMALIDKKNQELVDSGAIKPLPFEY